MNERIKEMNPSGSKFNQVALRAGVGFTLIIIAAAVVLAIGLSGRNKRAYAIATVPPAGSQPVGSLTPGNTEMARTSYAPIVNRVAPAVVTIRSEGHVEAAQQLDDPELGDLFGGQTPQQHQAPQKRS